MFLLALFSSGFAACDVTLNNGAFYDMNSDCYLAGRCVEQGDTTYCDCCNPYDQSKWTESSTGGAGCYGNEDWIWGAFFGEYCAEYNYYIFGVLRYIVETDASVNDGTLMGTADFNCYVKDSSDPTYMFGDTRPSNPDLNPFATQLMHHSDDYPLLVDEHYLSYTGELVSHNSMLLDVGQNEVCRVCSAANTCTLSINGELYTDNEEGHLMITMYTDFNTYYAPECTYGPNAFTGTIPADYTESYNMYHEGSATFCEPLYDAKQDNGFEAYYMFVHAGFGDDFGSAHLQQMNTNLVAAGINGASVTRIAITWNPHGGILGEAIGFPTLSPTRTPSAAPTTAEIDCFSMGYTHTPEDFVFTGVSTPDCRGGISPSWPGGQTCDSPYVICLPQENTPTANPDIPIGFPMGIDGIMTYPADDHRYSIDECKYACAFDQRCLGFEFVPDENSALGDCNLIDDIPLEVSLMPTATIDDASPPTADQEAGNGDLYSTMGIDATNPTAGLCYALKDDYCNPYFHEHELTDVMLNCYCPNNRKGFYTKKVVRTEAASRYCGTEPDDMPVTKRIRNAQANRMFHLCENWCLFNTETPRTESWYHDPWNECWREQYAGVGTHRSYCFRVIRDPMTIEQFFIDTRADRMCTTDSEGMPWTNTPTQSPVSESEYPVNIRMYLAAEEESCDDACEQRDMRCDGNFLETMTNEYAAESSANELFVQAAFQASGYSCSGASVGGKEGWALPGMLASQSLCITRNETTTHTPCNLAIGVGYRRLCACTSVDGTTS